MTPSDPTIGHDPVLLDEALHWLAPQPGQTFIDCTTGRGGHSLAIARALGAGGTLLCLDADPRNLEFAQTRLAGVAATVRLFHANFAELPEVLRTVGIPAVDGILADLGLSTNQLLDPQYGLSFAQPMPLDMRIDPRTGATAADLIAKMGETELANVLYELAQERYSRRIARKIVDARRHEPITTTDRLAELVRSAIPSRGGAPEKIDPATRTFLALRMAVNQECDNLDALLVQAPGALKVGGRLAVISFQSTEDRAVKNALRSQQTQGTMRILTKKPIAPSDAEIQRNPRSRSAKLRVAERCA